MLSEACKILIHSGHHLLLYFTLSEEGSLADILREVVGVSHIWFHLGLVLGLHYSTLKAIQSDHVTAEDCLQETMSRWLKQKDSVGQPSWRTLARALAHPLVGQQRLAEELAKNHPATEVHTHNICIIFIMTKFTMQITAAFKTTAEV